MLSARTALRQALRQGPGYGRLLMRRVIQATGGQDSFAPGSIYPALRALEADGQVRSWTVTGGKARGARSRTYYELTVKGVREAEREAKALAEISLAGRAPARLRPDEEAAMRSRVELVGELYVLATELKEAVARAGRR
jgi:DNA-binding PadR family transcriptional regulator